MANKEWIKSGVDRLTFGERLSDLIKSKGITQSQLAEKTGIKQSAISEYINGKKDGSEERAPDCATIIALSKFFSVSTDYLLGQSKIRTQDSNTKAVCEFTGLSEKSTYTLHCLREQDGSNRQYKDYVNHSELACALVDEFIDFAFNSDGANNHTFSPFIEYLLFREQIKTHNENAKKWNDMISSDERIQYGVELAREYKSYSKFHKLTHSAASDYYRRSFCDDFNDYLKEKYQLENFQMDGGKAVIYGID